MGSEDKGQRGVKSSGPVGARGNKQASKQAMPRKVPHGLGSVVGAAGAAPDFVGSGCFTQAFCAAAQRGANRSH
jgi:hypothetical protein